MSDFTANKKKKIQLMQHLNKNKQPTYHATSTFHLTEIRTKFGYNSYYKN